MKPATETRIRVRYAKTDQMGVVYYANYLIWMEVGRVELCRACGFTADVAEEGVGMLGLLQRHRPNCVIVDVMMPDQDGYEALKEIARFNPALPVMLVTGHGDTWLRMGLTLGKAQGLTAVHTAAKPVRSQVVRDFLQSVTG